VTVTDRGSRLHELGSAETVTSAAEALAFAARRLAVAGSPAVLDRAGAALRTWAEALDGHLFAPLREDLGDRPLVLVPTASLQSVPWSVLPSLRGRPVSVAPSAATWLRSSEVRASGRTEVVAVAGPGLAAADQEVHEIARARGCRQIVGLAATSAAVMGVMDTADTVHIAAHGRLRTDNPMLSSLVLADGPLTVYDLEHLAATPRLVVLPACRSGLSSVQPGDEVMGLAQALLAMGTQTVVATVVPVPDEATRPIMVDLHCRLTAGATPAEALAAAQLEAGHDNPRSLAAAAGFVCFGGG
jgi:CHAT domain-containing protein